VAAFQPLARAPYRQEHAPNDIEIAAVDPVNSMAAIGNPTLKSLAATVRDKLSRVIEGM
jgi:hypothetical protein